MVIASLIGPLLEHLPSAEWFLWLSAVAAMGLLVLGADTAVRAAAALAAMAGMSPAIIGATIVSLGTTTPETCVSVMAAWQGNPGLALGNAMGSIICDTALILGLCCVLKRLPMDRFVLNRHGWIQTGAGFLLAGIILFKYLAADGDFGQVVLGRGTGVVFLLLLAAYLVVSARWARRHPECIADDGFARLPRAHRVRFVCGRLALLVAGLAMVVVGSETLIHSTVAICRIHKVPESVIAGTIVALGTSLPELATALTALVRGHTALSVGNVIGADILNVLFVTGAAATAAPLQVDEATLFLMVPAMLLVLAAFRGYALCGGTHFRRWQGVPLLAGYCVYVWLSLSVFGDAP